MTMHNHIRDNRNTSSLFGIFLAVAGLLFLLKQFKVIEFDFELWPLFLIGGGVMSGMKKGFTRTAPIAMIAIGVAFLIPHFTLMGVSSGKLFWPILLMVGGIFIACRPKRKEHPFFTEKKGVTQVFGNEETTTDTNESFINIEAFFGGRKEIITSKQFSGCNATAICGGVEINLMQADNIVQPMVIDLRVVFGGVEIIVPSHWEVVNEVDVLFGGIEDKRNLRTTTDLGEAKKLLLRGSVNFGGLELKSY